MIRLGLTGQADCFHGQCFASIINGIRRQPRSPAGVCQKVEALNGFQVSAVYDPDRGAAEEVAEAFGISTIANSPEELAGMVDGVIIACTSDVTDHYRLAPCFLERKVPTYIDKPFAATAAEARSVIQVALRHDTPVLSCSARRYDPLIIGGTAMIKKEFQQILGAHVFGDWRYKKMIWYSVHAVDVLFAVLGPDVVGVHEVGDERDRLIKLTYRNGLVATVHLPYNAGAGTSVAVFGKGAGQRPFVCLETTSTAVFFTQLVYKIGGMIQSGRSPIPCAEMVHVIRVLNAAEQSLKEGRQIAVDMNESLTD